MTTRPTSVVPRGYHTVTPWIIAKGAAQMVAFIERVFAGKEKEGSRVMNPDGTIGHVEVQVGDSTVMLFDRKDDWVPTPAFLRLYVASVADTVERAQATGATVITDPTLLFFGEKVARVRDPWSNVWWIHERLEELDGATLAQRMRDPEAQRNMQYVQQSLDKALRLDEALRRRP